MRRRAHCLIFAVVGAILIVCPAYAADLEYKDRLLADLVEAVPGILESFDPESGAFGTGIWICRDQHPMYPLAVAYATPGEGNPYHKDAKLLDVIIKSADPLIENMDAQGPWMFEKKGLFLVPDDAVDEDTLMEIALDAGADDVQPSGGKYEVTCEPGVYQAVSQALAEANVKSDVSEIALIPKDTVDLDASTARKVLKLMERLDDHDDVQNVSSNFNIPDEVMAELGEE